MYPNNLNKYSFLGLRIMGSLIFIIAGLNHLLNPGVPTGRLQKAELGFLATSFASPEILIFLSGIGLLVGGFMLLIGFPFS